MSQESDKLTPAAATTGQQSEVQPTEPAVDHKPDSEQKRTPADTGALMLPAVATPESEMSKLEASSEPLISSDTRPTTDVRPEMGPASTEKLNSVEPSGSGEISLLEPLTPHAVSPIRNRDTQSKTSVLNDSPEGEKKTSDEPPVTVLHTSKNYDPMHDTGILKAKSHARRPSHGDQDQDIPIELVQTAGQREAILLIRGMVERLVLKEKTPITLGRTDIKSRTIPDVDLTPYGALDRGVSREHATLHIEGDRIFVTDLGSTNGTFLNGLRLRAHTPTAIRKGDELMLGRLAVQVLFR